MKIPVVWLREYVPVPTRTAELLAFCDLLTMAGLEVEEILATDAGPTLYTKITPNRGDWASVYGTAREAAAAGKFALAPLPAPLALPATGEISVTVDDPVGCSRYHATLLRGIQIGPSPDWMQERLTAAGMRPVNNVVDITNYVMLELGQPLHAFDADTLPGGAVVVRQARDGETLTTLDGVNRVLAPGMLCICDRDKPIALAGIMGGGPTEVTDATTSILLESAHFDPFSVRRTAKREVASEASYRFERFVDPALVPVAAARAVALLTQFAGATVVGGVAVDAPPASPRRIVARVERIRKLLGVDVDRDEMVAGLSRLGLSVERSAGALDILVPSWRPDLTGEDDIAEEVGRIALGYANLPETLPPLTSAGGSDSPRGRFTTRVRQSLVGAGLQDVLSHSLVAPSPLATDEEIARRVTVRSALSPELSSLRVSLVPNLLTIAARAHAAGIRDIALFEVGPVYRTSDAGAYTEPLRIAGVVAGSAMPPAWSVKADALPADLYFARGVVEDLLHALGVAGAAFAPGTHPITHGGRTASITVAGEAVGLVAELSEATVTGHDLPRRTYIFDLDGDALARLSAETGYKFTPLPRYPAVVRDLAPVFDVSVPFAQIEGAVRGAAGPLLESLRLTDLYTGPTTGEGKRSLTLRLTFRSAGGTLKEAEVEAALAQVRVALAEVGGELRG